MEVYPLRKRFGMTTSLTIGLVVLAFMLIAVNIIFVSKTNYGASFYSYWLAGRILFAQGGNPYGADLFSQVIENFPNDPNLSGFTLPLYAILLVFPLTFINNFKVALVIWMLILEAALIFSAIKIKSALQIDNRTFQNFSIAVVFILNYYSIITIMDGDICIPAVFFLAIALDAIRENNDELAGIMLAFATVKYSLMLWPILWISIWCIAHRRGTVVAWLLMVWMLLALLSTLFMTNWIIEFLRSVVYYYKYLNPLYLSKMIENWQPELGGRIGWAISGILLLIMLIEWVVNAKKETRSFEWVLAMTFTVSYLCGIPNIGKNLFALWIPTVYALDKTVLRWEKQGQRLSFLFTIALMMIPWITHLFIFPSWDNPIEILNILFPFLILLLLYWNRWWNIDTFVEGY